MPNGIGLVPCFVEVALKELSNTTMDLATKRKIKEAREYKLKKGSVTLLLIRADHGRYGAMKNQMQQNITMETNNYPKSIDETMDILNTFIKMNLNNYAKKSNYKAEGLEVMFTQARDLSKVTCYHCGKKGHFAKTCPEKEVKKDQVYTKLCDIEVETSDDEDELGYIYHQNLLGLKWKTCLLMDSESSINIFNNPKLLTEIYQAKKPVQLHCNVRYIQVLKRDGLVG